jgi:hypothetical protein
MVFMIWKDDSPFIKAMDFGDPTGMFNCMRGFLTSKNPDIPFFEHYGPIIPLGKLPNMKPEDTQTIRAGGVFADLSKPHFEIVIEDLVMKDLWNLYMNPPPLFTRLTRLPEEERQKLIGGSWAESKSIRVPLTYAEEKTEAAIQEEWHHKRYRSFTHFRAPERAVDSFTHSSDESFRDDPEGGIELGHTARSGERSDDDA